MKTRSLILPLIATASLAGCGAFSPVGRDREPTVGELGKPVFPPVPIVPLEESRKSAMRHYQDFLDESPNNVFVPEAIRRLADLNLIEEQHAFIEGKPVSRTGRSRAAQLYAELLERFPAHHRNDSALYQLARAYEQSGAIEPAMATLTEYTQIHAGGSQYDEAQFRRGEYLFVRRDYPQAEAAYQAVLDHDKNSPFHQQALYKIGWARFKQNDYEAALNAHMQLLDENIGTHNSADLPGRMKPAEQERLDDTLRAVSLSFSYMGDAEEVAGYFRRHGSRAYEPLIYAKLAALHLSKERFTDAAHSYRLFADAHPEHNEAPLFRSRVIDVFKQAGFGTQVLLEKQAFVERYQPASDYWKRHDPAQATEVLEQVQRHLQDVAQHYHAQAQNQKTPDAFAQAGRWYELYLRAFPASVQSPYMNFLYAELLTSAGEHGKAATQYERTAYNYGSHEKAADAGYAALLAYQKHESVLDGKAKADWHLAGIRSSLLFADRFADHPQALPVRTLAAQQLYALKDYKGATTAAMAVVAQSDAAPELQFSAWTVIAHAQFDLEDYQRAESAYQEVLSRTHAGDERRPGLLEKLAASIYKQGENARSAGDLASAAGHFLRIKDVVPGSAINVAAQYDAAAAHIALKQWTQAISILETWRRGYPDHELQLDATRKLAVLYQETHQPLRAAAEFTRIADSESNSQLKREALWTAASLYQNAGQVQQAIASYKRFVKQFPHSVEQAMEARQQLVTLYAQAKDSDKQQFWYRKIIEADKTAGAQRSDRTRFLAAHAQLALVEVESDAYKEIQLKEPLQKNLALKKKFMQVAIKGYGDAAAYKVSEVTTQATFRIGEIYSDFGKALMGSERPRNLNDEELEQYEILLEEQAYPFEEKAIEVHEANVQRIGAGHYDHWVKQSMAALAELMPVRYGKEEKSETYVAVLQ